MHAAGNVPSGAYGKITFQSNGQFFSNKTTLMNIPQGYLVKPEVMF